MSLVKLTEPGASHVVRVKSVTVDRSGKWPDYHFSDGQVIVVVPKVAADRQITERLKLESALDLVGAVLRVSRTEKRAANGNPYWDLAIENEGALRPQESKRVASPYDPKAKDPVLDRDLPDEPAPAADAAPEAPADPYARLNSLAAAYGIIYETMLFRLAGAHRAHDADVTAHTPSTEVPAFVGRPTAEQIKDATTTIFIQAAREGAIP